MTSLKQAIERALERRQAPAPAAVPTHSPPSLPGAPVDARMSTRKLKTVTQELEELRQVPGSHGQQLYALRGHFESCITQPSRYVDQHQLSRWTRGARRADRTYSADGRLLARWSKDLESDIRSVVKEAGLSTSATAAVVDAAKRGAIADNPGVLLCQIMALQSTLEPRLGRRAVTNLLRVMPALLNTSSDTISWHYEELATMLGLGPAASLVVKAPFVLSMAPFMVWSKLSFLQLLLGTTTESAQAIVVRQPRLLATAQAALELRLKQLQHMARLGDKAIRQLVLKQPSLLSYTPATLASNLAAMGRCLGISDEQVSKLLVRAPTLLMLSPSTVAAKLEALAALLACTPEQATTLVTCQPSVLKVSSELLAHKHEQLGLTLGTNPQETSRVLRTNPSLLTLSSATLPHKLGLLRGAVLAALALEHEALGTPPPPSPWLPPAAPPEQHAGALHLQALPLSGAAPAGALGSEGACSLQGGLQRQQQQQQQQQQQALDAENPPQPQLQRQQQSYQHQHHGTPDVDSMPAAASSPEAVQGLSTSALTASSTCSTHTAITTSTSTAAMASSSSSSCCSLTKGQSTRPPPPHSLAAGWLEQLEAQTPQQRAALACFSEKRFKRLPRLAAAQAATAAQQRVRHQQQQQQQQQELHTHNRSLAGVQSPGDACPSGHPKCLSPLLPPPPPQQQYGTQGGLLPHAPVHARTPATPQPPGTHTEGRCGGGGAAPLQQELAGGWFNLTDSANTARHRGNHGHVCLGGEGLESPGHASAAPAQHCDTQHALQVGARVQAACSSLVPVSGVGPAVLAAAAADAGARAGKRRAGSKARHTYTLSSVLRMTDDKFHGILKAEQSSV